MYRMNTCGMKPKKRKTMLMDGHRMKNAISLIVLVISMVAGCKASPTLPSKSVTNAIPDSLYPIREKIERLVNEGEVPSMAVAVARDGDIIWEEAFGQANREEHIAATEYTLYPLASISKPFTATGLMICVERGLIDLDKPANLYLGEAQLLARVGEVETATVRRIANHTAGLPLHAQHFYAGESNRPPPMDESIRRYGAIFTAPGERFQYSNLGYGILGYIIARLSNHNATSGSAYAEFMHQEVFDRLGMDHTSVYTGSGLNEGHAVKYTPEGLPVPPNVSDSPGASAIYSSVHDLIHFAMFHLKNELPDQEPIISYAAIDEMQRPSLETAPMKAWEHQGSGYGLGWFIGITEDGLRVVYHNGGTIGVSTTLALVPEENLAVAVLSNTTSQWPDAILIEILCTLLSLPIDEFLPHVESAVNKPSFDLPQEFVGSWKGIVFTYEGELPLNLKIEESGDIYARFGSQPSATPLEDFSYQVSSELFMNTGDSPYLRGWIKGELETTDVKRGQPTKLWLELQLRENILNGTLIAFSQREFPTGPLSHGVELVRK
jgi:CubicO group peptidase (beta-lactamase class C family)